MTIMMLNGHYVFLHLKPSVEVVQCIWEGGNKSIVSKAALNLKETHTPEGNNKCYLLL